MRSGIIVTFLLFLSSKYVQCLRVGREGIETIKQERENASNRRHKHVRILKSKASSSETARSSGGKMGSTVSSSNNGKVGKGSKGKKGSSSASGGLARPAGDREPLVGQPTVSPMPTSTGRPTTDDTLPLNPPTAEPFAFLSTSAPQDTTTQTAAPIDTTATPTSTPTYGPTMDTMGSNVWELTSTLVQGISNSEGEIWSSVAYSETGMYVAVGAPGYSTANVSNVGLVRIFQLDGSTWAPYGDAIVGEHVEGLGGQFGASLAISKDGQSLVVGAPRQTVNGMSGAGRVATYEFKDGQWVRKGSYIEGEASGDNCGFSVATSDDAEVTAVGCPVLRGNRPGMVKVLAYFLDFEPVSPVFMGESENDLTGYSVSLSGDGLTVAIGAPGEGSFGSQAGKVTVRSFKTDDSSGVQRNVWVEFDKKVYGDDSKYLAGRSLALAKNGAYLNVGMPGATIGGKDSVGLVRTFSVNQASNQLDLVGEVVGTSEGSISGESISTSRDGLRLALNDLAHENSGGSFVYGLVGDELTPVGDFIDLGSFRGRLLLAMSGNGQNLVVGVIGSSPGTLQSFSYGSSR